VVKKKDILTIVGDNIRQIRMSQGVSQNQLAFEAGVTREFINKVESGKNNISIKNLEKIADILEVNIKDLFNL
jgi:transcriptional regulator with XRE-family HTH domain